jgi:hypothetical protein
MPASMAEQVLEALKALLEAVPGATIDRNTCCPRRSRTVDFSSPKAETRRTRCGEDLGGWFELSAPCPSLWKGALSGPETGSWGISVQTCGRSL